MTNSKDTSNSITNWLDTLVQSGPAILDAMSIITGKRLSPNDEEELLQITDALLEQTRLFASHLAEIRRPTLNKDDVIKFVKLLDEYARALMPDIPSDIDAIDYLVQSIDPFSETIIEPLDPISVSYIECNQELRRLINDVYSLSRYDVLAAYLEDVDSFHEDIYSIAQLLFMKGKEYSEFLLKPHRRFTRKIAEKSMMIYGDVVGVFEKNVAIIRGLVEIVDMKKPDYNKLRSNTLGGNILYIRQRGYSKMVANCDLLMRNVIAHKSLYFVPSKYKFEFYDHRQDKNVTLSYREVVIKTQQLFGLLLSTNEWRKIVTAEYLKRIKNLLFITTN